jgi:hypothetical protein
MDKEKVHYIKHCHVDVTNYANPQIWCCDGSKAGIRLGSISTDSALTQIQQGLRINQGSSPAMTLITHSLNKEASQLLCDAMQCRIEDGDATAEIWTDWSLLEPRSREPDFCQHCRRHIVHTLVGDGGQQGRLDALNYYRIRHGNAGKLGTYPILSVLSGEFARFLFEFHACRFETIDLPHLPADRSDFDVHGALLDDKVHYMMSHILLALHDSQLCHLYQSLRLCTLYGM